MMKTRDFGSALCAWTTVLSLGGVFASAALAVDTGTGRAAAAVATIDPTSALVNSTQVRSYPGQRADTGMVQLFRFENGQAASSEPAVNSVNGSYIINLTTPLASGENIYVKHVASGAVSSTAIVQTSAAPYLLGPLDAGNLSVSGFATPGRSIEIRDAISGATLGSALASVGTGAFSAAVPALRMFQALRAVDSGMLSSSAVTILGFSAVTNAGVPTPTPCPSTVVQAAAPMVLRFECDLLHPRGVAALPDGSLRIVAGLPPSGLINVPPPATIRFDPGTEIAEMLAPVTGVGAVYAAGNLFVARPHLFRLRDEHMVERHDGEILQMDPSNGETVVATRLLDIAPTGIAVDTSVAATFGGGLVVSSLFYEEPSTPLPYPSNSAEPLPSAIWSASLSAVQPLRINLSSASPPLVRLHGLAVGVDFDTVTPVLFASQPGSGTIFRIVRSGSLYEASVLADNLGSPAEIAFPPPGSPFGDDLYGTDTEGGRILKITLGAGSSSVVQTYLSGLDRPFGLTFGSTGMFVTEYSGNILAIYP